MIAYPPSLKAVGGAKTGIAPVNLLDVMDVNGNLYFWSDRPCNAPIVITGAVDQFLQPPVAPSVGQFVGWAYPTTVSTSPPTGAGSAIANLSSGTIKLNYLSGLGEQSASATWGGFKASGLPPGAVITAIIPVLFIDNDGPNPDGIVVPGFIPAAPFNGQCSGSTIGSTLAALTAATITAALSGDSAGVQQTLQVSGIAFAVYYTLSTGGEPQYYNTGATGIAGAPYLPWLLQVPSFTFHRSLVTDMGAFVVQNLSGDTLSRDMEKILRASALEGALFVYRLWQPDAEAAWLEVHGSLTVDDDGVDTITFKGEQLINASQDDTPLEQYCETCQIDYGGRRCGATLGIECLYSFQTCQVVERIMVVTNNFEKNFGDGTANTAQKVINRRRRI